MMFTKLLGCPDGTTNDARHYGDVSLCAENSESVCFTCSFFIFSTIFQSYVDEDD